MSVPGRPGPASLPAWLDPLPEAAETRAIDAWAIDSLEMPSLGLMERAGAGLARLVAEIAPDGRIAVVCGKGNNGGDGFVAARLLREQGREVEVVCTVDPDDLAGDGRQSFERLTGDSVVRSMSESPAVIVDAVLGTGATGTPTGAARDAIEAICASGAPVVAADVPSGVDASTGEASDPAVAAVATGTFHAAKPGLWIRPGKEHAGEVRVIDIGIPPGGPAISRIGLIRPAVLDLIPRRAGSSNKFVSGHVIVAGGSAGMTGAPCLAAMAAMRAGAGYVTACVPHVLWPVVEAKLLEVLSRGMPDAEGALTPDAVEPVLEAAQRAGALVLGPGLGPRAAEFARLLASRAELPMVLDADGLNAHAGDPEALRSRSHPTLLTPHEGELGRLLGVDSKSVASRRLHHVREAADRTGAVVVLKGDDTLIASPDGLVAVNRGATPALATAGTGDVLSGVLGALLAKRIDPFGAACAGVVLHALAGRHAAELQGAEGVIASDVITGLPRSLVY
ncbi:MAG TPA: NAD(P)H-hydrate dehydratase [Solirubrobacteraceae bacterium]